MTKNGHIRYKLLPHMTDAYVEVQALTLAGLFEEAAFAMFDVMTDPAAIECSFIDQFEVTSHDEISLFHDWLEQLLLKFDLEGKVYSIFHVKKIETQNGNLSLVAEARGGLFEKGRHPAKVEIKAVTYHRMEIRPSSKGYVARYILDL